MNEALYLGLFDDAGMFPPAALPVERAVAERDRADSVWRDLAQRYHYSTFGGAPLLGVGGYCLICHGRSEARAIKKITTDAGLKVCCEIDANAYPKGVKVTDQEIHAVNITRHQFHGEWNYTISPNQQPP